MRFVSTLSLPLFLASLVSSATPNPNPDQFYSLQQASAYLKQASAPHIDLKPRFKKLDKRLRKEIEDEWAVHKRAEGAGAAERHLEKRRMGHGVGKGKGMQKKLRRGIKKSNGHLLHMRHESLPHAQQLAKKGVEVSSTTALEKRGGGGMFKGVSSYYLFALDDGPRRQVLDAIKRGGFSVVRIFLSGVGYNNKGSGNNAVPDLEPDKVGEYDDTILYKIDKLMADCQDRGLKLMIALSDRYALGFWSTNSYAVQLSIVEAHEKGKQSLKKKNAHAFYSDSWSIEMFEKRISHALNHENQLLGGRKWRDLSSVVYAFEAQNEPQGYMDTANPSWVCDRSNYISSLISGSGIQISSGGGTEIGNSLGGWATNCGSIDIVSVHDYGRDGYNIAGALARAKNNHPSKTIMMGEWGITGSSKVSKIKEFVNAFEERGIPWMYWQVTQPGAGDKDFEVWTSEPAWGALTGGSSYSPPPPASDNNKNDDEWKKKDSSSSSAKPSKTSSSFDDDKDSSATPSPSKSSEWKENDSSSSSKKPQWGKSSQPSWVPSATPSSTIGEDSQDSAAKSFLASHDGANSTSTTDQAESTVFVGKDGSTSLGSDEGEAKSEEEGFSTIELSPEDADQYSTISPDDLEGYSIVSAETSTSSSAEGASSTEEATSTEQASSTESSSSTAEVPINSPSSSVSVSEELPSSLEATAVTDSALPSESATPSPEILPSSTDSLSSDDNLTIKLPNCNYTLSDLNGTLPDANSTIHLLPSGIFCNSTLLPLSALPHPTPTDSLSASAESTGSPLLLFSSDPGSALPDFSTPEIATTLEIETPTETIQENDTAFAEVPTPAPAVEPAYVDVTLDADALLTMDLRDYSIVNR